MDQEKDWLIEQIVRLTLDAHSLEERDRKHVREEENRKKQERAERVKKLDLDMNRLQDFIQEYKDAERDNLIRKNLLAQDAPARGRELIKDEFLSEEGTQLLKQAKDMIYGLLFGDEHTNSRFNRTQRQILTLTIPSIKSEALDFMKATTQLNAKGTW